MPNLFPDNDQGIDAIDDLEADAWDEISCGMGADGCDQAGTEFCEFDCPLNGEFD